jgi:hypothetical protein
VEHTHTHTHTHKNAHARIRTHAHTHTCHMHARTRTHAHTHARARAHTHTHTHTEAIRRLDDTAFDAGPDCRGAHVMSVVLAVRTSLPPRDKIRAGYREVPLADVRAR